MFRLLEKQDYYKNYINLLKQLTETGELSYKTFEEYIDANSIKTPLYNSSIYVVEIDNKIIATGTLMVCTKIIHNCGKVAFIEDIVVDKNHRNMGLGKKIIEFFKSIAVKERCYKIILNCSFENETYYEKFDFVKKNSQMAIYFDK